MKKLVMTETRLGANSWQNAGTKDGKLHYLSGVDMDGDLYHPIYVEFDEYCENVRVYEEA